VTRSRGTVSSAPWCVAGAVLLSACNAAPASWDTIVTQRIGQERPRCVVTAPAPGTLDVRCPDGAPQRIDIAPIAQHCQRGPRDCEYAIDQVLLGLR